ncbi:DUF2255 family protein [Nocardia jiangxiensis]|uniref:DUF2255 family protein n=1 Tax=Nocardia jiangxiensis TaxID=282685 RepID=UPI00030FCFBA|nr:DUF2255 family protein [Nocardia jiangxiensis]
MTDWTPDELAALTHSRSLILITGSTSDPGVELGMVLVDGVLYVRAHRGPASRWYRQVVARTSGRISVASLTRSVSISASRASTDALDDAYRAKYGAAAALVTTPPARAATLRMVPA